MSTPIRLSLVLAASLLPAPLGAWTEDDLRVAERRMERQLATQRGRKPRPKPEPKRTAPVKSLPPAWF